MCCPFTKTEGIKGTPYNAAVNGCCGTRLYDLMSQDCCESVGRVLDKVSRNVKMRGRIAKIRGIEK